MKDILKIKNLNVLADDKLILKDLSLNIAEGELVALMGANGAGKSTLVRALLGDENYQIRSGQIIFRNQNLLALAPKSELNLV